MKLCVFVCLTFCNIVLNIINSFSDLQSIFALVIQSFCDTKNKLKCTRILSSYSQLNYLFRILRLITPSKCTITNLANSSRCRFSMHYIILLASGIRTNISINRLSSRFRKGTSDWRAIDERLYVKERFGRISWNFVSQIHVHRSLGNRRSEFFYAASKNSSMQTSVEDRSIRRHFLECFASFERLMLSQRNK